MLARPAPLALTAARLRSGELDLLPYLSALCDQIEAVEPHLQALLPEPKRRVRLLAEAAALQARFPAPASRPPLYGVPVGVKDIFRVDGFPTGAGSQLPPELFAGTEAACVTRLRAAGALIVGKTVSTEFAAAEPGPTRNPHNLAHTPGGSSSGSAAAVVAGYCPLAFGSQTIGSVIRPAAYCGAIGFKPTYGRIATEGVLHYSPAVDHVGLFTQDVAGLALAASLLCQDWQREAGSADLPVLGVPVGAYLAQTSTEGLALFEDRLGWLAAAGYTVRRVPALDDIAAINTRHEQLTTAEMAQIHVEWFPRYTDRYRPRTAALIRQGQAVDAATLAAARAGRAALRERLEATMVGAGIDLWVCPPAPGPAPSGLASTGSPVLNLPWSHAGVPAITLPAGLSDARLPVGMQFVARSGDDERLLTWAAGLAQILAAGGVRPYAPPAAGPWATRLQL